MPEVPENRLTRRDAPSPIYRQRGEFRELIRQSRQRWGINILVGRSIAGDMAALHEKEGMVALVGVAVLAAGLVGGLWFSRRAIKPIEAISATAAEISLSNLSRRIDVTGTETELTGLARTLNQMFDRIESAFSQQVRFTADASHELRTPVAVILSHAELALDKQRPAEELRETIETCRRSALRMRSLIESLLTLARFDSGEVKIESRWFDLSRTVGDCIALVRPLAAQRRIAIQMDLTPSTATGDPDRIAQVVTNLLTNAIRYNHEQGEVNVSLRSSPSEVVLVVSDTGIGIPPEHLAHIFERFYRVDNARSRKDGGVGLGLAICKSIVVAHGGQISVSSHVGRGTKFEVRLPKGGSRAATRRRRAQRARGATHERSHSERLELAGERVSQHASCGVRFFECVLPLTPTHSRAWASKRAHIHALNSTTRVKGGAPQERFFCGVSPFFAPQKNQKNARTVQKLFTARVLDTWANVKNARGTAISGGRSELAQDVFQTLPRLVAGLAIGCVGLGVFARPHEAVPRTGIDHDVVLLAGVFHHLLGLWGPSP